MSTKTSTLREAGGRLAAFGRSKLAQDLSWNTVASVVVKFRGLVLITIISNLVGIEWYGAWALVAAMITYAQQLTTLALSNAVVRFFPEERDSDAVFLLLLSVVLGLAVVVSLGILAFSRFFVTVFLKDAVFTPLVMLGALLLILESLRLILQDYYRARDDLRTFSLVQGGFPLLEVVTLTIVLWLTRDLVFAVGVYLAIASALVAVMTFRVVARMRWRAAWSAAAWRRLVEYLKYSLPLVPTGLSTQLASNGDRFIIGYFLTPQAVGLYGAAYALASTIMVFNPPITNSLFPKVSRSYAQGDFRGVRTYIGHGLRIFIVVGVSTLAAVGLFAVPVLRFMTRIASASPEAQRARLVAMVVVVSLVIYGLARIYALHLYLLKRTGELFAIYAGGALMNTLLNLAVIPRYGLVGAALCTLTSYTAMSAAIVIVVKRAYARAAVAGPVTSGPAADFGRTDGGA